MAKTALGRRPSIGPIAAARPVRADIRRNAEILVHSNSRIAGQSRRPYRKLGHLPQNRKSAPEEKEKRQDVKCVIEARRIFLKS